MQDFKNSRRNSFLMVIYCCITDYFKIQIKTKINIYYPYSFSGFGIQHQPCQVISTWDLSRGCHYDAGRDCSHLKTTLARRSSSKVTHSHGWKVGIVGGSLSLSPQRPLHSWCVFNNRATGFTQSEWPKREKQRTRQNRSF